MAGPFYIPSESGVALGGAFNAYYRLKIDQVYNAVSNESTLTITPQLRCTGAYTPNFIVFRGGASDVGYGRVYVDGTSRGTIGTTSGLRFRGIGTTMNTWVGVQLDGSAFTITVSGIKHSDTGVKTVPVYYEKFMVYDQTFNQTNGVVAATSPVTLTLNQTRQFALSVSASNCSVSVTKNGSTVSPGANAVTYGDVLTIAASPNTGYGTPSITVTGATKSGSTYTVTGPVTVTATAAKKTYTLTINQGDGSTIRVTRNGSVLNSGAVVSHFDQLVITMTANSGHHLTLATINDTPSSGGSYTVSSNVVVTTVAALNTYTLRLYVDEHTNLSVKKGGVSLSDNANISDGDVLTITASGKTGYSRSLLTVNGEDFVSTHTYTVHSNVEVRAASTVNTYALSLSPGTGSTISVMRGSEALHDGDTISYWDELVITAIPDSGYGILTLTVNGSPFANGATHVVSAAVTVATTTEELVGAYLRLAAEWARFAAYINAAGGWARYIPYIKTTTGWVKY